MRIDMLGHVVDRAVDGTLSQEQGVRSIKPATGLFDHVGFFVFTDAAQCRVLGKGYNHQFWEAFIAFAWLSAAGAQPGEGVRCHQDGNKNAINVPADVRIGIRRVGNAVFVGLAYWYEDRKVAEAKAIELRQPAIFNLLPANNESPCIRAMQYGDYRMFAEARLSTVHTDIHGNPLD